MLSLMIYRKLEMAILSPVDINDNAQIPLH